MDCITALNINPNYSDAYAYKGKMKQSQKRYEQGLDDCNMAIKLDGKNIKALNCRGLILNNLKDYETALADFSTVI